MKKNTTISFLILLSIMLVSSNISAEEATADVNVNIGAPAILPRPEPRSPQPLNPGANMKANTGVRAEARNARVELRQDMRANVQASTTEVRKMREENKAEIKKIRADFQSEIRTKKASSTEIVKEKRQALIEGIQEKRDLFKKEIELKKEAVASSTLAIRAKFKEDLAKIKDEKKKAKVENIGENLLELNAKITARATENVNKIEGVLIAIESRADKATAAGATRLANVRALIAVSETAIADARAAISVQTAKTYAVSIQSDATVKTSLESTRNLLKADIDAMNAKIKAAHEATKKAAAALKAEPKANATTTAEVTGSTTLTN